MMNTPAMIKVRKRLGIGLVAIVGVAGLINYINKASEPAAITECRSDWKKCTTGDDILRHYKSQHGTGAKLAFECQWEAKKRARYGEPQWPDRPFIEGFLDKNNGIVILTEDDAKFQNGFGVYGKTRVLCTFDLNQDRVTDIQLN